MSDILREIREELTAIKITPSSEARTMSPPFYTSPEFLDLEEEYIFRKEWVCLGHSGEIPDSGDYFTTEIVGEQLVVIRGKEGDINVLSNVCRHRGNILLQGTGNKSKFSCAYHAWTYDNEGQLLNAPFMDKVPSFDKENCRLPKFNTEIWNGFILSLIHI